MTIILHGGSSFSSSFDDFLIFRLEIRQIWEQSFLNRPVWVLLELIQLLVFLELFVLLERLQLLHVLPAFLFCSRWVFFLPARHPHSILRLRHVTNSP